MSTICDILSGMVGGVSVAFLQQLAGARLRVNLSKLAGARLKLEACRLKLVAWGLNVRYSLFAWGLVRNGKNFPEVRTN